MRFKDLILILIGIIGVVPGIALVGFEFIYWFNHPDFTQMEIFKEFLWWNIGVISLSVSCFFVTKHFTK